MTKVKEVSSLTIVQEYSVWSLYFSLCIALFWYVYSQQIGPVPEVTELTLFETYAYTFPSPISRWFDVLIPLIWGPMFGLIFVNQKMKQKFIAVIYFREYRSFWMFYSLMFFISVWLVPIELLENTAIILFSGVVFFVAYLYILPFMMINTAWLRLRGQTVSASIMFLFGTLSIALRIGIVPALFILGSLFSICFPIFYFSNKYANKRDKLKREARDAKQLQEHAKKMGVTNG